MSSTSFFLRRRLRKRLKDSLHHTRHLLNMRGDLMESRVVEDISGIIVAAKQAYRSRDHASIPEHLESLSIAKQQIPLAPRVGLLSEYVEIFAVAVSIAMAFRAYFFQPFQIPTGSMQPTLYGVRTRERAEKMLFDRFPLSIGRFLLFGVRHREITVRRAGELNVPENLMQTSNDPTVMAVYVGSEVYQVPRDIVSREFDVNTGAYRLRVGRHVEGARLRAGDTLWAGDVYSGDHIFVNKLVWNFAPPRYGDVSVFGIENIAGISHLPAGTHYIKRIAGTPNQRVRIKDGGIYIDGAPSHDPRARAMRAMPHKVYEPFRPASVRRDSRNGFAMSDESSELVLGSREYCAFGDNTDSSADSRYWGAIPEDNMVGRASFVYWPISERWGFVY